LNESRPRIAFFVPVPVICRSAQVKEEAFCRKMEGDETKWREGKGQHSVHSNRARAAAYRVVLGMTSHPVLRSLGRVRRS
jgi:hypothetical protein